MRRSPFIIIIAFIFTIISCDLKNPTENDESTLKTGTVTDIDGNTYQTVKIGNQWWMAENLKVTHYRNNDEIPNVTYYRDWYDLSTGAYCDYNNNEGNVSSCGRLYNWYAVNDSRNIAPEGWHVPTDEEWKELEMYLGMSRSEADNIFWRGTNEGKKLKSQSGWISNGNGSNTSGFSALPCGGREFTTSFEDKGYLANFWTSAGDDEYAWKRCLGWEMSLFEDMYPSDRIWRQDWDKNSAYSVRCVKD